VPPPHHYHELEVLPMNQTEIRRHAQRLHRTDSGRMALRSIVWLIDDALRLCDPDDAAAWRAIVCQTLGVDLRIVRDLCMSAFVPSRPTHETTEGSTEA